MPEILRVVTARLSVSDERANVYKYVLIIMDSIGGEIVPINIVGHHSATSYGLSWEESISSNLEQIKSLAEKAIFGLIFDDVVGSSDHQLNLIYGNNALSRIRQLYDPNRSSDVPSLISALGVDVKVVDTVTGVETGAYSKSLNAIFLSDQLILNNTLELAAEVLIEEVGHAVDNAINLYGDSPGDEGELFSAYVLGKNLENLPTSAVLEDDFGNISYYGGDLSVEFNKSVTLFQDAAYKGRAKTFGIGDYAFIGADFNDIATSISISPNQNIVVELFEHANFQGRSTVVSYSQASIGADWNDPNWRVSHLNDAVSSIRV